MTTTDVAWALYPKTVLDFHGAGGVKLVDLRRPLDDGTRAALTRLGRGCPFAVVTACDPYGAEADAGENARRTAALGAELYAAGAWLAGVTGRSPDGGHAEPGFAGALDRESAVACALRWEQLGLFWFDGGRFWLVAACYEAPDVPLPSSHDGVSEATRHAARSSTGR